MDLDKHPDIRPIFPDPVAEGARYYEKTGMFPSHNFVIEKWGYAICAKAVLRHKRQVLKTLGLDQMPETDPASKIKRKKAVKA